MTGNGYGGRGSLARDRSQRQQGAPVPGHVSLVPLAGQNRLQPLGDVRVVVESEHRVGLGERVGQFVAVALGQATDRDHGLRTAAGLEVRGGEQGVDRVLLGRFDEAAGVDHHRIGILGLGHQPEATVLQSGGQFLRVDLVSGTAQGHQVDGEGSARFPPVGGQDGCRGLSHSRPSMTEPDRGSGNPHVCSAAAAHLPADLAAYRVKFAAVGDGLTRTVQNRQDPAQPSGGRRKRRGSRRIRRGVTRSSGALVRSAPGRARSRFHLRGVHRSGPRIMGSRSIRPRPRP